MSIDTKTIRLKLRGLDTGIYWTTGLRHPSVFKRLTLLKEALIEIGCVVTSLVGWLVVTLVHCGQTVHPRPIVTMEH